MSLRGSHCQGTATPTAKLGAQLCRELPLSFAAKPSLKPAPHQRQQHLIPLPMQVKCLCKNGGLSASEPQCFNTSILSSHPQFIFHHYLLKLVIFFNVHSVPKLLRLSPSFPKLSVVTLIFALFPEHLSLLVSPSPFLLHLLS